MRKIATKRAALIIALSVLLGGTPFGILVGSNIHAQISDGGEERKPERRNPTPTRTPTATVPTVSPTFTPTLPPPLCSYYRVDVKYEGDWGMGSQAIFQSGSNRQCINQTLSAAKLHCSTAGDYMDDCVAMYMLGNAYHRRGSLSYASPRTWRIYPFISGRDTSINGVCTVLSPYYDYCLSGSVYFDLSCRAIPRSSVSGALCSSAVWGWRGSPISLIWDDASEAPAQELTLVEFPLFSEPHKRWVVWKASKHMPLLVFDPHHTGVISSGEQLFGSRTFGGKPGGSPWEHGFEALATLDANKDGKVSGTELDPLALWFDENRDGVSQPGEVKPLTAPEIAVTALFFKDVVKDQQFGDVFAKLGFERTKNSKTLQGAALDWFTEGGSSKDDLLSKLLTTSRMSDTASPDKALSSSDHRALDGKKTISAALSGVWAWETDDPKFKGSGAFKPGGFLTFTSYADGTISGHSYIETDYANGQPLKSQVDVVAFNGTMRPLSQGISKISFEIFPDGTNAKTNLSSNATLNEKDFTLQGVSNADVLYNDHSARVTYSWKARKLK